MSKVIFYTPAYNAEKTLRRAVDSVLAQSHADFIYYLLDNASTDGTREIVKEYAAQDSRIIPLYNEINWGGNWILDIIKDHGDDCRLCELDADDEYTPDFLEKMLAFMHENNLEIAACGNDFIDTQTNKLKGVRKLDQDLLLEGSGFSENFPHYHQFMRTVWGKVFSLSVLRMDKINAKITYGGDTLLVLEAFRRAGRVGILAESLHKYYVFPKSVSFKLDDRRIASDQILFESAHDYLISKCGTVSEESLNFLYHVYLYAIEDTIKVLTNAQISVTEKLSGLCDILKSNQTQELIKWKGAGGEKNELFRQIAVWVLSQQEVCSDAGLEIVADILATIGMYPSQINGWQDGWIFMLLAKIKDRLTDQGLLGGVAAQIVSVASKSPLLIGFDTGFLTLYQDIVFSILQQDEKTALGQIEDTINLDTDIPDEYIETFLELGLKLSARLEYTNDFIFLKKLQISLLIDLCRTEEAKVELADWDEVLPNDMDFKELRKRLTQ
ncbi:MAG: glycosyltransferase family 2 protein [Bacillota bacterium]